MQVENTEEQLKVLLTALAQENSTSGKLSLLDQILAYALTEKQVDTILNYLKVGPHHTDIQANVPDIDII